MQRQAMPSGMEHSAIGDARNQCVDVYVAGIDFDICLPAKEGEATDISSHHEGRCVYIAERNIALCPMGNVLYYRCARPLPI